MNFKYRIIPQVIRISKVLKTFEPCMSATISVANIRFQHCLRDLCPRQLSRVHQQRRVPTLSALTDIYAAATTSSLSKID